MWIAYDTYLLNDADFSFLYDRITEAMKNKITLNSDYTYDRVNEDETS